jgi:hypothetical protein
MNLRRLFRAPVPISLLFATLAIFALLVAPSRSPRHLPSSLEPTPIRR